MRKVVHTLLFTLLGISFCLAQTVVKSDDAHIHYMGRVDVQADRAVLSWSGTSLKINFKGAGVKALLRDEYGQNFYNVLIDGVITQKIQLDTARQLYILAANLATGNHSLELYKLTEWGMGKSWFYEFDLDANTVLLTPPATKSRKIEFFGNSITCGYAVLDSTGKDRGTAPYEDNYKSYAAITARHFDAEYYCTARSGIGILASFGQLIMPQMYNRLDATDSLSRWDFSKFTPDVVVINQFQNDAGIISNPDFPQFKSRFGTTAPTPAQIVKAYQDFVTTIRKTYPKAHIICALGNMTASREGSPWSGYIKQAVKNLNDSKIYPLIFPFKGTGGHPSIKEQQAMATDLIAFIEKNVKW